MDENSPTEAGTPPLVVATPTTLSGPGAPTDRPDAAAPTPGSALAHAAVPGASAITAPVRGMPSIRRRVGAMGERLNNAYRRGCKLLIRQSSQAQAHGNLGSQDAQAAARQWLALYGFETDTVEEVWALGESGQQWANRPVFDRVHHEALAGRVGILILPLHSRAGRYDVDTLALFDAIAKHDGYILVERQLYDPKDHNELFILKFFAILAELQARATAIWMAETRLQTAEQLAFRRMLPVPLVWAARDDAYEDALSEAGMTDVKENLDKRLEASHAKSELEGRTWYPLPLPHAGAYKASELLLTWFFETRSVAEVCRRVRGEAPPGLEAKAEEWARLWPENQLGLMPRYEWGRWSPDQASDRQVTWVPVSESVVRAWLQRPALYGIYSFTPGNEKRMTREERAERAPAVLVRDAFMGLRPSSDYDRVCALLKSPRRVRTANRAAQEWAVLPTVRCAHPLPDGKVCGRTLSPAVVKGEIRYMNPACTGRSGHTTEVAGGPLLRHVLQILVSTVRADAVQEAVATQRVDGSAARQVLLTVEHEVERLTALLAAAEESEDQNRAEGKARAVARARARQEQLQKRLDGAEARLTAARADGEALGALGDAEGQLITALAGSLPDLLTAIAEQPDLLRPILATAVAGVFVRRTALSTYEVDVDFPTGVTVRGAMRTAASGLPQPVGAYASARLAAGADAAQVSVEVRRAWRATQAIGAERVVGAAAEYALAAAAVSHDRPGGRNGAAPSGTPSAAARTLGTLAAAVGESVDTVLGAALDGLLGHAWAGPSSRTPAGAADPGSTNTVAVGVAPTDPVAESAVADALLLAPTKAQLHEAFPEFARRAVARAGDSRTGDPRTGDPRAADWPVADCVHAVALRAETATSYRTLLALAGREGCSGHRYDEAGRCYVRRSDVLGPATAPLDVALEAAPAASRALAREHWVPVPEFARRAKMPPGRVQELVEPAARLTVRTLCTGALVAYAHAGPELLAALARASLTEAVRRLGDPDLRPETFHTPDEVLTRFGGGAVLDGLERWSYYRRTKRIRTVSALGTSAGARVPMLKDVVYAHVPPAVWAAATDEAVGRWLGLTRDAYTRLGARRGPRSRVPSARRERPLRSEVAA